MICTSDSVLMHKDRDVCTVSMDEKGAIRSVRDITAPDHLPVGTCPSTETDLAKRLDSWWSRRSIPASRDNLQSFLYQCGLETSAALMAATRGLSLSDCYWIRPVGSDLRWNDVNCYDNDFSEDLGMLLFGEDIEGDISLKTPDASTDGRLKKRWSVIDGSRCLIKAGSRPFHQEPYNEAIASEIMRRLGIDGVDYRVDHSARYPVSICRDFTDPDNELVSASAVNRIMQRSGGTNYEHTVRCFREAGMDDPEGSIDRMLVLDFIVANEDRHYGNFGLLRDPDSLECTGFAPIYDSGSSLGYRTITPLIAEGYDPICKPFKENYSDQIRLVHSFDWLDLSKLDGIEDFIRDTFQGSRYIDEQRVDAIAEFVRRRIDMLDSISSDYAGFRDSLSMDFKGRVFNLFI